MDEETEDYTNIINKGKDLLSKIQAIFNDYSSSIRPILTSYPPETRGILRTNDPNKMKFHIYLSMELGEYRQWVNNIIEFLETNNKDSADISYFEEPDGIPIKETLERLGYQDVQYYKELVRDISNEIRNKIERIRQAFRRETDKNSKIVLLVNKEKMEVLLKENTKFKYPFRKKSGTNKRFKYLIKIFEDRKVSAGDLMKYADSPTIQNLSKEVAKVNKTFKKNLGINDDLITNDNNSGYTINSRYDFELTK